MSGIGVRFKEIRKMLGLNQRKFAEEIGISQTHVSSIELEKDQPSSSLIKLVCVRYNLNEDWLTTGNGNPVKETEYTKDKMSEEYNHLRIRLEKALNESSEEDAALIVDAFGQFVSLLTIVNGIKESQLSPDDKHSYINSVRRVLRSLWKMVASVTIAQRSLPSLKDALGWWNRKKIWDSQLFEMQDHAKNATNLFLSMVEDTMRL